MRKLNTGAPFILGSEVLVEGTQLTVSRIWHEAGCFYLRMTHENRGFDFRIRRTSQKGAAWQLLLSWPPGFSDDDTIDAWFVQVSSKNIVILCAPIDQYDMVPARLEDLEECFGHIPSWQEISR